MRILKYSLHQDFNVVDQSFMWKETQQITNNGHSVITRRQPTNLGKTSDLSIIYLFIICIINLEIQGSLDHR